jgi:phosphoenolpyruvate carboxykinase (GTP)
VETTLGWMPRPTDLDLSGLNFEPEHFAALQSIPHEEFKSEILGQEELFLKLAGDLPKEMIFQRELLISRL